MGRALFLVALLTPLAATAETPHDRVERLHREGRAARDRGDRERALELLTEAWTLRKTHDGAASLAQVEYELGMMQKAATHLAYACEHLPASAEPARVARLLEALERIKEKVVTIRVSVQPKTAEVFLNGQSLGIALELPKEVFADPGTVTVAAEFEGYERANTVLNAPAGESREVALKLHKRESAAVLPPPTAETAATSETKPPPSAKAQPRAVGEPPTSVPLIVTAALSGGALAAGAAFWIAADAKQDEADNRLAQLPGENRCGRATPYAARCADIRERLESAKTFRALSLGAFATSAVGGAISYFVWPRSGSADVSIGASLAPSAVWTGAQGRF